MSKEKKENTPRITANLILEVIGRPPEHLNKTLEDLIKKMGEEKNTEVTSKKINEPTLLKNQKDFFTNFAEVEVEVEEVMDLVILMFKYMPAHIEVIEPETLKISNNTLTETLSELVRNLHRYDEIVRITQNEKNLLKKKLEELNPELFKKEKPSEKDSKKE